MNTRFVLMLKLFCCKSLILVVPAPGTGPLDRHREIRKELVVGGI